MKIDVLYSGQLRYAETSVRQKEFFKNVECRNVFSLLDFVQDSHAKLALHSSHMFDSDKDFKYALNYITEQLNPEVTAVYSKYQISDWFNNTYGEIDTYKIYYIQHIYTFLEGLKQTRNDVVVAITTDLILDGDLNFFLKKVELEVPQVYCQYNNLLIPHVIILNNKAREIILNNADKFLSTFFIDNPPETWFKAETIWEKLFEYCGIKIKILKSIYQCKVRPTMVITDLDKSINQLSIMFQNWRKYKDSSSKHSKFKIDKKLISRIVAYGCSYTAGDEFLDTLYRADAEEIKKRDIHEWFSLKHNFDKTLINTINEKQRNMAWPAILANRLSIAVDNRAIAGNSLASIVYQIEKDFANGEINEKDLVVVGLTSFERNIYFSNKGPISVLMHMKENFPHKLQKYQGPIADFNNSMFMYYFYYLCLSRLIQLSNNHLKGRLFIVPCINDDNYKNFDPVLEQYFQTDILNFRDECLNSECVITDKNLYNFVESLENDMHSGGHPKQIVHERFVTHLLEVLQTIEIS